MCVRALVCVARERDVGTTTGTFPTVETRPVVDADTAVDVHSVPYDDERFTGPPDGADGGQYTVPNPRPITTIDAPQARRYAAPRSRSRHRR
jgi:hypothetical protein